MKILWADCETGGLDARKCDILTLAGIVEIEGEVKEEFYFEMQPFDWGSINDEALKINGLTREQIKTFMLPQEAYKKLIIIFSKYINRFDKNDKFLFGGHNPKFDIDFLSEFFKKNNDKYFGSWFDYHCLDTVTILHLLKFKKVLDIENCKLVTAAQKFGISLDAHNSMNDIRATRELFYKLLEKIEVKE